LMMGVPRLGVHVEFGNWMRLFALWVGKIRESESLHGVLRPVVKSMGDKFLAF
jgi:hypothetical protein